jgi:hypothetical protein
MDAPGTRVGQKHSPIGRTLLRRSLNPRRRPSTRPLRPPAGRLSPARFFDVSACHCQRVLASGIPKDQVPFVVPLVSSSRFAWISFLSQNCLPIFWRHLRGTIQAQIVSYGRLECAINIENRAQGYCFAAEITSGKLGDRRSVFPWGGRRSALAYTPRAIVVGFKGSLGWCTYGCVCAI